MDHNIICAIVFFALSIVCTIVAAFCNVFGRDGIVSGMCSYFSTASYALAMFCLVFTFEVDTNLMIAIAFAGTAIMKVNGYFAKKVFTKNEREYQDSILEELQHNLFWLRPRRKNIEKLLSDATKTSTETESNTTS